MILAILYEKLMERLAEIPGVQLVEQFNNQIESPGEDQDYPLPAIYVDIDPGTAVSVGRHQINYPDCTIVLHICTQIIPGTSSLESDQIREDGLANFALMEEVLVKLQGWNDTGIGSLQYVGTDPDKDHDQDRDDQMTFRCWLKEIAAVPARVKMNPSPDMELTVEMEDPPEEE